MQTIRRILLTVALGTTATGNAGAQVSTDSVHLRNDCRLAAQILQSGEPANKREWALGFVPNCGASGVAAIAEKWRANENSNDSSLLVELRVAAFHLSDRTLFETFLGTAGSSSASSQARIESWRYLLRFSNPGLYLPDEQLAITPVDRLCSVAYFSVGNPVVITPLPADFQDQVDAVAIRVAVEMGDVRVRRFASCVHQFIQQARSNPT